MVICIIALPVFALLGLFSLKYRMLAAEAFRCMFRTIQLKPCDTGLDIRIKSKFTAKLMWWPFLARVFYRYFTLLSWIFVILTLVTTALVGYGLYNLAVYGNCNGPNNDKFCIFNVVGVGSSGESCSAFGVEGNINIGKINISNAWIRGNENAPVSLIEYGCYSCHYTKEAEAAVREVLADKKLGEKVKLVYMDVPLDIHPYSVEAGEAAICAGEQGKYWEYHDILFERQSEINDSSLVVFALEIGLNESEFNLCLNANSTKERIKQSREGAIDIGLYGTPTFIIGEEILVGPQKASVLKGKIEKELD
ncbi:MAG: thioredoxin domain-containing protein [Candidatus Pacearchaeota archaeon]